MQIDELEGAIRKFMITGRSQIDLEWMECGRRQRALAALADRPEARPLQRRCALVVNNKTPSPRFLHKCSFWRYLKSFVLTHFCKCSF